MTDHDDIDEMDLLALADGLLDDDPVRKAAVEAAIALSPDAAERLADYRAQTAALRASYAGVLAAPVPERLYDVIDHSGPHGHRTVLRRAAAVLMVAAVGYAGWLLGNDDAHPPRQALLDESYRQFVLRGPNRAVSSTDAIPGVTQSAIGWGEEDVSIRLSAPDLSADGFTLVEKRALRRGEDQIVALEYRANDGRAFSLFLAPRWENRPGPIVEKERGGVTLAYWHDGPLASSIATRLPRDEARSLAETVRRAMRDKTTAPPPTLERDFQPLETPKEGIMADTLGGQPGISPVGGPQGSLPSIVESN